MLARHRPGAGRGARRALCGVPQPGTPACRWQAIGEAILVSVGEKDAALPIDSDERCRRRRRSSDPAKTVAAVLSPLFFPGVRRARLEISVTRGPTATRRSAGSSRRPTPNASATTIHSAARPITRNPGKLRLRESSARIATTCATILILPSERRRHRRRRAVGARLRSAGDGELAADDDRRPSRPAPDPSARAR